MKSADYIKPADLAAVVAGGAVCAVKYALREAPDDDAYLSELVERIETRFIVSGRRTFGHQLTNFKLHGFTSGSVSIAPALSAALLQAFKSGNGPRFARSLCPLKTCATATRHGAYCTPRLRSGVAHTGPLLPFLRNLSDKALLDAIGRAARELLALNVEALNEPA